MAIFYYRAAAICSCRYRRRMQWLECRPPGQGPGEGGQWAGAVYSAAIYFLFREESGPGLWGTGRHRAAIQLPGRGTAGEAPGKAAPQARPLRFFCRNRLPRSPECVCYTYLFRAEPAEALTFFSLPGAPLRPAGAVLCCPRRRAGSLQCRTPRCGERVSRAGGGVYNRASGPF